MALTQQQIKQLDAASARIASGSGSATDKQNISYATQRQGYKYQPGQTRVFSGPQTMVPFNPGGSQLARQSQPVQAADPRQEFEAEGYQYLGSMDKVNQAIRQYGRDRVQNVAGDYYVLPKAIKPPTPGSILPADAMRAPAFNELSNILGANITGGIDSDIAGLLALQGQTTESQNQYDELTGLLTDEMGKLGGQAGDIQAELEKQGVNQAYQQVKELSLRAAQLQGELGKFDAETEQLNANIDGQAIPTGLILGQKAQLQKQRDLTRMAKAADLSSTIALTQAYQGNAQLGMELAQSAVDLKYQPILSNIETLKTQIGFAGERMTREERKRTDIINKLISIRENDINEEKNRMKDIESLAIKAAIAGAPSSLVQAMRSAQDSTAASQIGAEYLSGRNDQLLSMVTDAAMNGAPQSVIDAMRSASDPVTAARIGSQYLRGDLESLDDGPATGPDPSPGFFDIDIESSIREDATALRDSVASGLMTVDQAYSKLRSLYNTNEAANSAIWGVLDPGMTYRNRENVKKSDAEMRDAAPGDYARFSKEKRRPGSAQRFLGGAGSFFTRRNPVIDTVAGWIFRDK